MPLEKVDLEQKGKINKAEVTLNIFKNITDKISKKVRLAEEKGCSPSNISDLMIQEASPQKRISDEEREIIGQKLVDEEEAQKSAKKKKNRRPKKTTKKKKSGCANRSKTETPYKFKTIEQKPKSKSELREEYTQALFHRKPKLHRRVKRWATVKKIDEIRKFTDFDKDGNPFHRYQDLSEEEINDQWMYHNLFGTEKIIADLHDKSVYSFPTNLGSGMLAELIIGGRREYGVIYFGLDKEEDVAYHRYFEKIENAAALDIFQDQQDSAVLESDDISNDTEWQGTLDITVSQNGVISLIYPSKSHSVRIFPIRKDLLDKSMF